MNKEQTLRNFYFSIAELIANVENCERLCPVSTILEMCETLAGIMKEQMEIIATLENITSEGDWREVREKFRRPITGARFYSSHIDALCDFTRLAKHLKELSESKDELKKTICGLENFEVPLDVKLLRTIFEQYLK